MALRIAAHNGAPVWGGAEIALARVLAGLAGRGHAVRLYCNDPEVKRRAAGMGLLVARQHLGGDIALHHSVRFGRELRRRQPDVLLLGTFRKLWLGTLAGRIGGVERVVARIGLETDMPRSAKYRFVFRNGVDAVVFNADGMRARFQEALPDFRGDAITIHTGVRAPALHGGGTFRAVTGIPLDAPLLGSVGRLAAQKRYDRLVDVLTRLPDAHAVVVGEGPARAALERRAAERGVAERFHLPGHQDDVGLALDAMDLFVLTSDREGMSNAMLEALAAGVPVVSTDVSGAREALLDPRASNVEQRSSSIEQRSWSSGHRSRADQGAGDAAPAGGASPPGIVTGFAVDEIAGVVRGLLADRRRLGAMGEAARDVARERFSEERMLDDWEALLQGRGRGRGAHPGARAG